MKLTKHSIKPYSKDISETQRAFYKVILKNISEAHEAFYKSMKGYIILAWFLKKKKNTKDINHVNKTKSRYTDNC